MFFYFTTRTSAFCCRFSFSCAQLALPSLRARLASASWVWAVRPADGPDGARRVQCPLSDHVSQLPPQNLYTAFTHVQTLLNTPEFTQSHFIGCLLNNNTIMSCSKMVTVYRQLGGLAYMTSSIHLHQFLYFLNYIDIFQICHICIYNNGPIYKMLGASYIQLIIKCQ